MSLHAPFGLDGDSPFFLSFFGGSIVSPGSTVLYMAGQAVIAMLTLQGRILVFPMLGYFRETSAIQALFLKMGAPQNLDQFMMFQSFPIYFRYFSLFLPLRSALKGWPLSYPHRFCSNWLTLRTLRGLGARPRDSMRSVHIPIMWWNVIYIYRLMDDLLVIKIFIKHGSVENQPENHQFLRWFSAYFPIQSSM